MKAKGKTPHAPRPARQSGSIAALLQQAAALHRQGRLDEAAGLYAQVLAQHPTQADALHWLGVIDLQKGKPASAADLICRSIAVRPNDATTHAHAGNALRNLNRLEEALASYDRALTLRADYPEALANRASVLRELKRHAEALAGFEHALALRPAFVEALYNRGNALRDLGRSEEALSSYDRALALRPAFAEALANRGNALHDLKRYEEALSSHERTLALNPDMVESHFNRGNTLRELGRPEEALASYEHALTLNPAYADAHSNRGNALLDLRRHADARTSFDRALALVPDHAGAHWNQGAASLLVGDFERGWREFEWRWRYESLGQTRREFRQPQWDGAYLDGVLLAWGEQGLGDQILYLSMVGELAERARELIVSVDARLVPLVQRSFPRVAAIPLERGLAEVSCDAHVPLGSIGQYLRRSWSDFPPKRARGYLVVDAADTQGLRARLARNGEAICGLSWFSGSGLSGRFKSMALQALQPVLGLPGWRFVDLQYGDTRRELETLDAANRAKLVRVEDIDNRNDIDGLAALICACDVVMTVSNVTAHVAGALGRPVMLMLPYSRGRLWYWHEDRDDSPWYRGTRLFRQATRDDWAGVVERVKRALEENTFGKAGS